MYKAGTKWLVAGISSLMLAGMVISGQQVTAHAADNGTNEPVVTQTTNNNQSTPADTDTATISSKQQLSIVPTNDDGKVNTDAEKSAQLSNLHITQGDDLVDHSWYGFNKGTELTGTMDNHSNNVATVGIDAGKLTNDNHNVQFTLEDNNIKGMTYQGQPISKIDMTYTLDIDPTVAQDYQNVDYRNMYALIGLNMKKYLLSTFNSYTGVTNPQNVGQGTWAAYVDPSLATDFFNLYNSIKSTYGDNFTKENVEDYLRNNPDNAYATAVAKKLGLNKRRVQIQVFSNLADGFYGQGIKNVTVNYRFYNEAGQLINFKNDTAFLSSVSLNHDQSYVSEMNDHVETVKAEKGAEILTLAGSRAQKDANGLLYDTTVNTGYDGIDKTNRPNWDYSASDDEYKEAGIISLNGSDIQLSFGLNPTGNDFYPSARFRFTTLAADNPIPEHNETPDPTPTPDPVNPQTPTEPEQPVETPEKAPADTSTTPVVTADAAQPVTKASATTDKKLPQTGNESTSVLAALGLVSGMLGLGMVGRKKRN